MNERAHIIEIERIVVSGGHMLSPARLRASVETQVQQALRRAGLPTIAAHGKTQTRLAGEIAKSVVQAIVSDGSLSRGGRDGV